MSERVPKPDLISRAARRRNWAIFVVLAAIVALFYVMTIVRMGGAKP
ncbi:MAG TPA: hypothetical protein VMF53_09260 [Alphaproteobacteria bacterium]|nr:hypothetical protein [Alphaproteobacteria bacterium]